jgi:UDPglucose 6-dehydrogenase
MLATRISFMNELARLCDKVGADIDSIRHVLGTDPRIGPDFLYPGLGYGGSCLPKDLKAIIQLGREYRTPLSVIESVDGANHTQREWFWQKVANHFGGEKILKGKRIAVWGIAFKANTDDVRFAPSLDLISNFLKNGAIVSACDPVAECNGRQNFGEQVSWHPSQYDCLKDADALIICTEWLEFRSPDFERMKNLMKSPVIFDGRNLYDPETMRSIGFIYNSVGR